ncbi:MAG: RHS repeat protein, partial [Bryobacterales bacterium]|nr:RHS repeat protein [Bryobacterales bacterium]
MNRLHVVAFMALAGMMANGQNVSRNLSDGLTPPAVAPGAPAGVKALSGLESINLYSGHLSVTIPLLQVGGRGEAGYEIVARGGTAPWTMTLDTAPFCPLPNDPCNGFTHTTTASNREQNPFEAPYAPGVVFGKRSGTAPFVCATNGMTVYQTYFTHLVFEQPDGTQVKLVDSSLVSPEASSTCGLAARNRGTRFTAMGISQIVFVSDATVVDDPLLLSPDKFAISGVLLFPNGVEYRVDVGVVTRITDRNGNKVTIQYAAGTTKPNLVTDSLGREVTIEHDVNDPTKGWVDRITYKGKSGVSRVMYVERVRTGTMPIRSDLASTTLNFGNADGYIHNFDRLLKKVWLADGRSYELEYTRYGEVAKLKLPTGGSVEYDHGAGLSNAGAIAGTYAGGGVLDRPGTIANTTSSDPGWRPAVYRRLLERRTYPTGGSTAEATTSYSRRESGSAPWTVGGVTSWVTVTAATYMEETTTGTGITGSITLRHSFFEAADTPAVAGSNRGTGSPLQSMINHVGAARMPNDDNVYEGVEYKTVAPGLHSTEKGFVLATDTSRALRVCQETVLAGGSTNKRAETLLFYDARGNVTETYAYGYGDGPELTRMGGVPQSCGAVPAGNTYQRRTVTTYKGDATYVADSRHLWQLPATEETFGYGGTQVAKTVYEYDGRVVLAAELSPVAGHDATNYPTTRAERGNVTAIHRYKSSGAALTSAYQYDLLGNARYVMTPVLVAAWSAGYSNSAGLDAAAANAGKWTYADACDAAIGSSKALAFVTGEELPKATSTASAFSTSATYDCYLGQPTGFTDINGVSTAFGYGAVAANYDQLILLKRAAGTGAEAQTSYEYALGGPSPSVAVSGALRTASDGLLRTKAVYDGFGREVESQQHNGTAWVVTKKVYDGAHRVWKVYNPTTGTPTVFTETAYDGLGRPTQVTAPGGAKTTYSYSENETTVTDPANVKKKLVTDALGRLESVMEDPGGLGLTTKYFYSATGNLLTVCPNGGTLATTTGVCTGVAQARTFTYDWLGRLLTVANPESSPISYGYDETASTNGAGQLTSKSQLRGVTAQVTATTRFHYDSLGRMTSKTYTGAPDGIVTPAVTYTYDAHNPAIAGVTSYAKGRRTRVEVTGGLVTTIDSFDEMGRATRSSQGTYRFGSDTVAGYEYLRSGALSVMRLPTGRTLTYTFDDAGRPTGVGDGATTYASSAAYTEFGAMSSLRMNGWKLRESRSYDASRLQLTGIGVDKCTDETAQCTTPAAVRAFGLVYTTSATGGNGSGPNNNGSVRQQTISDEGVLRATQVYGYDALDRLTMFTEGTLSETNCYDAHGNRAVLQRAGLSPLVPQVVGCGDVGTLFPSNRWAGTAYDAAGGIGNDGRSLLRYDGEDRLVGTVPVSGGSWTQYGYDGDGKRVLAGGVTFVYDAFGKLAVEYGGTVTVSGREFVGVDHLGSTRTVV